MTLTTFTANLFGWGFIILLVLKLLGKISISWWLVTFPLWWPLSVIAAVVFIFVVWFAKNF